MAFYTFAVRLPLEPIRLARLESEREAENLRNSFEHHINPFRELDDEMHIVATVKTPAEITDEQSRALADAFNQSMREFRSRFESRLRDLEDRKSEQSA